jgi:hypothetical protein
MHQKQSSHGLIGFSYEKYAGHRYRQGFLFGKMYTIFSAVPSIITQVPHTSNTFRPNKLHVTHVEASFVAFM